MTRSVSTLMTIATFALLPLAVVNASAQAKAHVDVPWGFVANHHYVPAGYYEVLPSDNTMTLIDAKTGRAAAILLVHCKAGSKIENRGRLEFYVSGSRQLLWKPSSPDRACTASSSASRSRNGLKPATRIRQRPLKSR